MAKLTMDWNNNDMAPKRGDLLDFPKTRYMVVKVRQVKRRDPQAGLRFNVCGVKLEELADPAKIMFWRSAVRNGGQIVFPCTWNHRGKKKKLTFEDLMRRGHPPK
jgi:hypothetical protein